MSKNKRYQEEFMGFFHNFERLMQDYSSKFESKEKIREFKRELIKEAEKKLIPLRVNVSPLYEDLDKQSVFNLHKCVLNVGTKFANTHNNATSIKKLVSIISKLPKQSHLIHSRWMSAYMLDNPSVLLGVIGDKRAAYEQLKSFINGRTSYDNLIKLFRAPQESEKNPNIGGGSDGSFMGGRAVGYYNPMTNLELYKESLKNLSKRLLKEIRATYEPSLRSGTRINRSYVNGLSYKPLMQKSTNALKKNKVMIIHDCSGSMGVADYENNPAHKAVSYIGALVNSGIVDVTHVVYHSSTGWKDMKKELSEGKIAHYYGDAEGFQYLDDNLPSEWVKDVDFIIVTTDLCYSAEAQEGLFNYVKRAKAHLILSFKEEGTLNGLCVSKVDSIKEMMAATVKLVR